ncbi:MAG: secretin N-terminal domain-containing protein [Candidatus Omnitrophica bacterium]|nr:secretin N-terminal domain-containing protein [Candidatus Omnitrophota bacterium]MDD5488559.1 secretin N-terminal domain-containing protein [Candidatus Omnitrophota bacterium]
MTGQTLLRKTILPFLVILLGAAGSSGQDGMGGDGLMASVNRNLEIPVSLDLRDMDVVDVYKFLALRGDFNISISKNISGRVTLYLKNVSIRDALDIISLANELAYKIVGSDIIYVMTEAEYQAMYGQRFSDKRVVKIIRLKYLKPAYALEALKNIKSDVGRVVIDEDTGSIVMIDTADTVKRMSSMIEDMDRSIGIKVFDLKYANADDVASKLKEKIDNKSVGSTQADTRSNQVIVRAFPDRMKEVEEIISALDVKTKAVLIDVKILKITLNPGYDSGIDWQTLFHGAANLALAGSFPLNTSVSQAGSFGQIAVGNSTDDFRMDLKFQKEISSTKILASPSIMVTENEEAKVHIGDKLAYITTTTIGTGDSQRVNEEIHYIDVGVKFLVTPKINDDGFVSMKIKPEISSRFDTLTTQQGTEVPLINTTTVETDVIVKDGHTIIIAGLRQDNRTDEKSGVPGLMKMPFFGGLFSNRHKEDTKTELVILLTPHIVAGDENYHDRKEGDKSIISTYKEY